MKILLSIILTLSVQIVLSQQVFFSGEPVDSIWIQAHQKLEGSFDQGFATKGNAEYLRIEFVDSLQGYFTTRYYRDDYLSTYSPDTLNVVTKNLLKEYQKIRREPLDGLLQAMTRDKRSNELLTDLDTVRFQKLISDWRLMRTSRTFEAFYYLSMKHLAKAEGIPTLQNYHSSDSIKIYLKERFDTTGLYFVRLGTKAETNLSIYTPSNTWYFHGRNLNHAYQPWYNVTDSIDELPYSVLNFNINKNLVSILPKQFMFRERMTLKAIANDYISWYLERQGMK